MVDASPQPTDGIECYKSDQQYMPAISDDKWWVASQDEVPNCVGMRFHHVDVLQAARAASLSDEVTYGEAVASWSPSLGQRRVR